MANTGVIPPADGYLAELRRIADEHDVLLWIDETVTGFRLAAGGAQEQFGVHADLVTFGKALGAGFPVAALAGPAAVMDALAGGRVLHYGTQNANPALLAVVRESLDLLTPDAFAHALFEEGGYLSPSTALHSVLATVHTQADVERIVHAARAALARV